MNVRSGWSLLVLAFTLALGLAPEDARAHSGSVIDGILTELVGDPNPKIGGNARRLHTLTADDGHKIALDLSAADLPPEGMAAVRNRRVRVTTDAGVAAEALSRSQHLRVRTLEVLDPTPLAKSFSPAAGNQKYVSVLCKWPDIATEPRNATFFANQLGGTYPGFDHYFQEVSYGTANITGSIVYGWVTMPNLQSFYDDGVKTPGQYLPEMFDDCTAAADAAVNFHNFVGVNLMFNGIVDGCCAWGGGTVATLDGLPAKVWSATWMPYWGEPPNEFGWLDHGVLAHELSHSFGSPHSDDPSGFEYGNYWDVVSRPGGSCAVIDATFGCVAQHQVANNKIAMGIVPAGRITTHASGGASTAYNIERMAQPPGVGGTTQIVKVLTPLATKYYTVESRFRTGYDQNVPGDGVLIHEVITNRPAGTGNPARLLRPDGATGAGLGGLTARWLPGNVYVNAGSNVKITVNAFDAGTGTANVTVQPATDPGAYSFALAGTTVIEGNTTAANIAVTRSAPFTTAGSVAWTTADGTALAGADFGTLGSVVQKTGTLTWAAGTGGVKNITVGLAASNIPVIGAVAAEPAKDFAINLSSPTGGVLGAQASTTITIADGAVVNFTATAVQVAENAGNVVLTVARTGSTVLAQVVNWTTANGTALAGSDFGTLGSTVQRSGSITFPAGSGATQDITIPIINDTAIEGPETFTVTLTTTTNGAMLGPDKVATVTINSDEAGISMAVATRPFTEGAGAQQILVNRAGSTGNAISVNYTVTNGTALRGTHFNSLANGTLNWGIGDGAQKAIDVDILNDAGVNTARTFTVTLSAASGATLAAPMSTAVTINDDDTSVQFLTPTITVAEGIAGGNLTLTVARSGVLTDAASVTYTTADGTGLAGTDFGVLGNTAAVTGTVSWAPGVGGNKTFPIPILNDLIVEGAKTFTVQLSNPVGTNISIGANSQIAVTLNDNDAGLRFSSATYEVTEGVNPSVVLTVQRIGPATMAATATWATVNVTATSGQDFGVAGTFAPRTGTLSWIAGDATAKTITIPIINDLVGGESDETFTVVLTPGAGLVLGTPGIATVTIHDDDIPPESTVQFSAPKFVVLESVGNAALTVNRTDLGASVLASSVKFSTVAGSALATSDYTTVVNGTLNWAAGDFAPKTILIPIVNNAIAEPPEFFKVVLSLPNPGTGIGALGEATVWIFDDDEVFPLDGAMPAGFVTAAAATTGWHVSNDPGAYEGAFALKSDEIDDNESAGIEMAGTFAAGNVTFRVKVSSEAGFDKLIFYVDGVPQTTWSGVAVPGWQLSPTYSLAAGAHTLSWMYIKDGSVSVGMDAVYIDALITPAFTP